MGVFDGVGLPGAAAVLDADAQADDLGIGALGQFRDPRWAAASVRRMTCGRGRGFGLADGVGEAGVMAVM